MRLSVSLEQPPHGGSGLGNFTRNFFGSNTLESSKLLAVARQDVRDIPG